MNNLVHNNEDIHSLDINNLSIIQDKSGFRFGMDAVLLSDFARDIKPKQIVMDLCAGNGIISLLLSAKLIDPSIISVEIQEQVAELANRNVALNNLENCIKIVCMNLNNLDSIYSKDSFDAIVCNPPYKKLFSGALNNLDSKTIARHEVYCSLEDIARVASFLLKPNGCFYMVHRPDRLCDIISTFRQYNLEPKVLRFVQPNLNKAPNLLLIKAVKGAKPFLRVDNSLIVYNNDGSYTKDILKIYNVDN